VSRLTRSPLVSFSNFAPPNFNTCTIDALRMPKRKVLDNDESSGELVPHTTGERFPKIKSTPETRVRLAIERMVITGVDVKLSGLKYHGNCKGPKRAIEDIVVIHVSNGLSGDENAVMDLCIGRDKNDFEYPHWIFAIWILVDGKRVRIDPNFSSRASVNVGEKKAGYQHFFKLSKGDIASQYSKIMKLVVTAVGEAMSPKDGDYETQEDAVLNRMILVENAVLWTFK